MKLAKWILLLCCFLVRPVFAEDIREPLKLSGFSGGVIVHLGCGDGRLTAELRENDSPASPLGDALRRDPLRGFVVQGLDKDAANVAKAREHIKSLGIYGRVSVDQLTGASLPYTDNLVNLVVCGTGFQPVKKHGQDGRATEFSSVPMAEVMRVLCPGGVVLVRRGERWEKTVKPWPKDIDEWTHYLHGPDGNPVAQDRVVGPPKHYQWLSEPLWLRSHESDSSVRTLVTAKGKLFYIVDEAPASLVGPNSPPDKWFLAARDAFNGVLLWKVPIKDWGWRAWKPSWFTPRPGDIPLNIQKRLVAVADKVYVTLGYRAPVSELDARTGKVLRTYDRTAQTAEILYYDGSLILTVLQKDRARVTVVDASSGRRLWTSENSYRGTTTDYYRFRAMRGSVPPAKVDPTLNTATDGRVVALLDGQDVVCLDFNTGKEKWRTAFPLVEADYKAGGINAQRTLWAGTLIVQDGVLVHASPNQLAGFSTESGKILWTQPKKYLQHLWYEWKDVFIIDGLVWTWSAELRREKLEGSKGASSWPVSVNGYDLHTGRLVKKVPLGNIFKTHHHHRCYRNKATSRYILASRRGTEFVDLEQAKHTVHNWVRGTCHMGMMPANGLQYAPPHPCVCYIDEKLNGFTALAPALPSDSRRQNKEQKGLLQRGPAYGKLKTQNLKLKTSEDWPMFRHDTMRSGSVKTNVPARPGVLWREKVGGRLASPVAVDGRLFVPLVDEHHIVALSAADGKRLWEYAAGARIDSPPSCCRGTVIFGSADGWVYCLRADDGHLVWRFRAAPEERRIGAFGQLESAWPVHGSVLVLDGTAYFAAGRTSQLDGGIYLYGLDALSGELRCRTKLEGPHYDVDNISQNFQLPMGALPDILMSDESLIYMRELAFNTKLEKQEQPTRQTSSRVYSKAGLLDDSYFKRTPWSFGPESAYARLIVHDEQTVYFARMFDSLQGLDPKVYFTPASKGYLLFATDKNSGRQTWSERMPVRVNTMVAAKGLLFVAGPPDIVDPKDPLGAFEGRKGGVLNAFDSANGEKLWQYTLWSPPVFNGMIAANQRLYVSLKDGTIVCMGKKKQVEKELSK